LAGRFDLAHDSEKSGSVGRERRARRGGLGEPALPFSSRS
jgi:hypothetical protein